jgi:putative addiction module killer protein
MYIRKTSLFEKWFDGLKDKMLRAAIKQKIKRIEEDGYLGRTKPIIGYKNISEIKFEMGAGYRIYFNIYIDGKEIWFLTGGDKSTQSKDIAVAQELLIEIQKQRKEKDNDIQTHYSR